MAQSRIDNNLSFPQAIDRALEILAKSTYKTVEVTTTGGTVYGEFVSKSAETLVLKNVTDSTHLESHKVKATVSFIKIDSITSISINILE